MESAVSIFHLRNYFNEFSFLELLLLGGLYACPPKNLEVSKLIKNSMSVSIIAPNFLQSRTYGMTDNTLYFGGFISITKTAFYPFTKKENAQLP